MGKLDYLFSCRTHRIIRRSVDLVYIGENLSDESILELTKFLPEHFRQPSDLWRKRLQESNELRKSEVLRGREQVSERLQSEEAVVKDILTQVVVDRVLDIYP
jgi:phosphatidylinositol kinase/protein kinase (PI-3  family)